MKAIYFIIIILSLPLIQATDKESTFIIISVSDENVQNNNLIEITAKLQNSKGEQIEKQILTFFVNNKIFANRLTNNNGLAQIQFQAKEDIYKVQVEFEGSDFYQESKSEIIIIETIKENNVETEELPIEIIVMISILTLGIAGTGILYYLNKNSKR